MGISASTVSRERTANADATEAVESGQTDLDDLIEPTASAAEMSNDDDDTDDGGNDCNDNRCSGSERSLAAAAGESASNATGAHVSNDAAEVTDRSAAAVVRRTSTSTNSDASMAEFRAELRVKREQRLSAIGDLKNEIAQLRHDLAAERLVSQQLRDDARNGSNANADSTMLRMQLAHVDHQLQLANGDVLSLTAELATTQKQVAALKEVIVVSKEMVNIREAQLEQVGWCVRDEGCDYVMGHYRNESISRS